MELNHYKQVYFLGIGGIGMSALARWFQANHYQVAGYDKVATSLTRELAAEGIEVVYEEAAEVIPAAFHDPEGTLVVYTPAIPTTHPQWQYFQQGKFTVAKRAAILGAISQRYFTVAVAGTHGKTTTSAIVAHLLKTAKKAITAFVGGIMKPYQTNVLLSDAPEVLVVEADAYDRSFLTLHPDIAIITATDADHLDVYGEPKSVQEAFDAFIERISPEGKLFLKKGIVLSADWLMERGEIYTFGLDNAQYYIKDLRIESGRFCFDIQTPQQTIQGIALALPGAHNIRNALAAVGVAEALRIPSDVIKEGLNSFGGVKRRFEVYWQTEEQCLIDDYAHHPEELKALLTTARQLYPAKNITIIFQPHLYTRTRDFAAGFAQSLSLADRVILLQIYPAREQPIPGVDAQLIAKNVKAKEVKVVATETALVTYLRQVQVQVCITAGAGDVDKSLPQIQEALALKVI
ncbi:MAG: UDP-N-acetylmuramate--L-alanine ligase [Thermonemataceae bacterium]